jgi:hypothetical protein
MSAPNRALILAASSPSSSSFLLSFWHWILVDREQELFVGLRVPLP